MPKFGIMRQEQTGVKISAFEPVFGKRKPDVGPLNLRIVAQMNGMSFEWINSSISLSRRIAHIEPLNHSGARNSQAAEGGQETSEEKPQVGWETNGIE